MVILLHYVQLLCAVSLIGLILLQRANTDASGAGGSDGTSAPRVKRGAEKTLHQLTVIVATIFAVSFIIPLFLAH